MFDSGIALWGRRNRTPGLLSVAIALLLGLLPSCSPDARDFSPPLNPPHTRSEDGYLHAARREDPFSCGISGPNDEGPCPSVRPADDLLSCDALGCHGSYQFGNQPQGLERALRGSDGPSCYTCHDEKWEDERDDRGEDD